MKYTKFLCPNCGKHGMLITSDYKTVTCPKCGHTTQTERLLSALNEISVPAKRNGFSLYFPEQTEMTIDCDKIELHLHHAAIDVTIEDDYLKEIDSLIINGIKFVNKGRVKNER